MVSSVGSAAGFSELTTFFSQQSEQTSAHGGGLLAKIQSLLDQYRSNTTDSSNQATASALSEVA